MRQGRISTITVQSQVLAEGIRLHFTVQLLIVSQPTKGNLTARHIAWVPCVPNKSKVKGLPTSWRQFSFQICSVTLYIPGKSLACSQILLRWVLRRWGYHHIRKDFIYSFKFIHGFWFIMVPLIILHPFTIFWLLHNCNICKYKMEPSFLDGVSGGNPSFQFR